MTFCPIHEHELYECDADCRARRPIFKRLAHALNVYWHDRLRRGVGYVPLGSERRCASCRHLYSPRRFNQRFCSEDCRRRDEWRRRYDKLHRVAA